MQWPDGTHSLVGFDISQTVVAARVPGLRAFWTPGPVRPESYRVVAISRHDWRLHATRPGCASPDCPR